MTHGQRMVILKMTMTTTGYGGRIGWLFILDQSNIVMSSTRQWRGVIGVMLLFVVNEGRGP